MSAQVGTGIGNLFSVLTTVLMLGLVFCYIPLILNARSSEAMRGPHVITSRSSVIFPLCLRIPSSLRSASVLNVFQ